MTIRRGGAVRWLDVYQQDLERSLRLAASIECRAEGNPPTISPTPTGRLDDAWGLQMRVEPTIDQVSRGLSACATPITSSSTLLVRRLHDRTGFAIGLVWHATMPPGNWIGSCSAVMPFRVSMFLRWRRV